MNLDEAILESQELALSLYGLQFAGDRRTRTALACYAIAQQHHSSILILLRNNPPVQATALALLRPLLEATLRGEWIYYCATDEQIEKFIGSEKGQMDMSSLLRALEQHGLENAHAVLYKEAWPILSSMTHSFGGQVMMWLGQKDVVSSYPDALIEEFITWSSKILRLTVASIKRLAKHDDSSPEVEAAT